MSSCMAVRQMLNTRARGREVSSHYNIYAALPMLSPIIHGSPGPAASSLPEVVDNVILRGGEEYKETIVC